MGDSYAGSGKGAAAYPENARKYKQGTNKGMVGAIKTTGIKPIGYKRKDLMGIPWELAFALRADGWYLRQDIIWYKPNCMPESVKDRCTKSHEYIFMLSKSETYYYDYEAIKEPCVGKDTSRPRGSKGTFTPNSGRRKQDEYKINRYTGFNERYFNKPTPMLRNKRDVWKISTRGYKNAHFATFPEELARNCLLAGCRPGGTALDPFAGSGTVAAVAVKCGRDYIAIELNENYAEMTRKRIQEAAK